MNFNQGLLLGLEDRGFGSFHIFVVDQGYSLPYLDGEVLPTEGEGGFIGFNLNVFSVGLFIVYSVDIR